MRRALVILSGAVLLVGPPVADAAPATPASLTRLVDALGGDPARAGSARYADLRKLDGRVQQLAADRLDGRRSGGLTTSGLAIDRGRALVDVYVEGDLPAAAAALRTHRMDVTAISRTEPQRMVEGWLPVDEAAEVAGLDGVSAVVPVTQPLGSAAAWPGAAASDGDARHRGPAARATGATGAGMKVGIISDSIDKVPPYVAGSQASGDLPAHVQIVQDQGLDGGSDEGRAMAEIVYDMAPGVTALTFATATGGPANKAANIAKLVDAGVQVIADDTSYPGQPWFQDGAITQAVDRAVADGTTYVVSAGNAGREAWTGTYSPGPDALHAFGPGVTRQPIATLAPEQRRVLEVQWQEPWDRATTQFELTVYEDGVAVGSTANAAGIPSIQLTVRNPGDTPHAYTYSLKRLSQSGAPVLKTIVSLGPVGDAFDLGPDRPPTIAGDAALAAGAITTAAVFAGDPGLLAPTPFATPEAFSSRGPATVLFAPDGTPLPAPQVRAKPEVAGADGVATTVPELGLGCLPSGDHCFFGTSAAAPAIAAIAALVRSARPALPAATVRTLLTQPESAIDCTSAAGQPDVDCGAGFLLADRAVRQAGDRSPPVLVATTDPAAPAGTEGWHTGPVGVTWTVTDAGSPVLSQRGCEPSGIGADGVHTFTCSATSVGGTTTQTTTVKRDTAPPTTPAIVLPTSGPYTAGRVPAATCTASDATSGLLGCTVTGSGVQTAGVHTMTATATDRAGLTSTRTATYVVAATAGPEAATGLRVQARTRTLLLRRGLPFRVRAAGSRTRLVATLTATVMRRGRTARVTVGTRTTTIPAGPRTVTLRLSARGRALLRGRGTTPLRLRVVASGPGLSRATLVRTTKMKR